MPILLPSSSFKSAATVAVVAIFSLFTVSSSFSYLFVSYVPVIYDNTVFFLKPPYLYLVVNCIIVSIVATSKLNRKSSIIADSDFSEVVVIPVPVSSDVNSDSYLNVVHVAAFSGFVENEVRDDATDDRTVEDVPEVIADKLTEVDGGDNKLLEPEKVKTKSDLPETEKPIPVSDSPEIEEQKPMSDSPEISILKQRRKPPRFNQQKMVKSPSEGGGYKKTASLGVTKPPRRQDTLETTWKKITEGRSTPLTKQLNKSDTWQEKSHGKQKTKTTTKSENLDNRKSKSPNRLTREPSPGQEELNQRVEAFIKKFNEEMRLQRLQSLAKYQEEVNTVAP